MSTLAEINASLQKLKPTNQFQALTQEWIAVATEGLDPLPRRSPRPAPATSRPSRQTRRRPRPGDPESRLLQHREVPGGVHELVGVDGRERNYGVGEPGDVAVRRRRGTIAGADRVGDAGGVESLPGCVAYLADEPAVGNTGFASQILAMQAALAAAVPGLKSMIAYYDADSVEIYKGISLVAADIYVNKFSFN